MALHQIIYDKEFIICKILILYVYDKNIMMLLNRLMYKEFKSHFINYEINFQ
jgi:hypothetical protein